MPVHTLVTPAFTKVAELFDLAIAKQRQGGAAFAVYVDGECVLDLHGGEARPGEPWSDSTLSLMFSNTKGFVSVLMAKLVEDGTLDPELPVVTFWPEFASISATLTVRQMMEHRAGLSAARAHLTLDNVLDHDNLVAALLAQEPLWEPGTGYAYHAITFGTLADELIRRVDGRTASQMFRDVFAEPLVVDAWIGLPPSNEHRVAEFTVADPFTPADAAIGSPTFWAERALTFGDVFPLRDIGEPGIGFNSPAVHQGALPGANAISSAHGIAKMWSSVVTPTDNVRTVSDDTVSFLRERRVSGPSVWGEPGPWSDRGFGVMLDTPGRSPLLSPTSFGHDGFGGQAGWADVRHRAGIGFVTNRLIGGPTEHDRWVRLVAEVRKILEND
ncbi:MAG: serine hydrolase domain-containing protein [Microbacteriaceae bacterium]